MMRRAASPHPDFNPPGKPPRLTGRKSTITGLFFTSLTPYIEPGSAEVDEALGVLGMTRGYVSCAYCGDKKSEWDHFRPVVRERSPTGYITEIANLVPTCGKCNQSKRGDDWHPWITGKAPLSPTTRRVPDLEVKIARLKAFEAWREPTKIPYAELAGQFGWSSHLADLEKVLAALAEAETRAEQLRKLADQWARTRR